MTPKTLTISGWGNHPTITSTVFRPESLKQLHTIIKNNKTILPFGNQRSYGDAALSETTIDMRRLDKILSFDTTQGIIKAEAGVTLADLLELTIPKGWFALVTPGTKFVTLAGCAASNVHGKNQHKVGNFASCVRSLDIITAAGTLLTCTRTTHADLFWATLGGMGLTGAIYAIELQLQKITSPLIETHYYRCKTINEVFRRLRDAEKTHQYTVAWIDTLAQGRSLGRGVVIAGNHAQEGPLTQKKHKKTITIPCFFPNFLLNKATIRLFNWLYYHSHNTKKTTTTFDDFFYPLDAILHWNKLYGRRGFTQYQCAIPTQNAQRVMTQLLTLISTSGTGSFLAVLKEFKTQDPFLSFPIKGYTLALDLPLGKHTKNLVQRLDTIVKNADGRVYLAKDALLTKETFKGMYPELAQWKKIKEKYDPHGKFTSLLATRIGLT